MFYFYFYHLQRWELFYIWYSHIVEEKCAENENKTEMKKNRNFRNKQVYTWQVSLRLFAILLVIALLDAVGISISYTSGKHMTDRMMTLAAQQFRDKFFSEELRQNKYLSLTCRRAMQNVEKEALYFPIPESDLDKSLSARLDFILSLKPYILLKFFEKYISSTVLKYSKSTLIFDGVTPYLVVSHNQ